MKHKIENPPLGGGLSGKYSMGSNVGKHSPNHLKNQIFAFLTGAALVLIPLAVGAILGVTI